jgi:hypothetical protein
VLLVALDQDGDFVLRRLLNLRVAGEGGHLHRFADRGVRLAGLTVTLGALVFEDRGTVGCKDR